MFSDKGCRYTRYVTRSIDGYVLYWVIIDFGRHANTFRCSVQDGTEGYTGYPTSAEL